MSQKDNQKMIDTDPEWIYSKRFSYNINNLLKKYPEGCPPRIIATVLCMTEDEVEQLYQNIVQKLRKHMKVDSL